MSPGSLSTSSSMESHFSPFPHNLIHFKGEENTLEIGFKVKFTHRKMIRSSNSNLLHESIKPFWIGDHLSPFVNFQQKRVLLTGNPS